MSLYTNLPITRRKYTKIVSTKTSQIPKRISYGLQNRQRVGEHKNCYKKKQLRKKKYRRKKGLRIWNEEIKNAIEDKRRAYQKYLQNPSEENVETYKKEHS